jgi:hypothetical protein
MMSNYTAPMLTVRGNVMVRTLGAASGNTFENTTNQRVRAETQGDASGASSSFASTDD